jgi:hypothetical protein
MPARSTTWLRRTRGAACLVIALAAALPAAAQAAAPANDDLAGAQIVRVGDHLTGTVVDATRETDEPATSSPLVASTVWYRFNATASERVRIDTCGSDRYAELAVYTGVSVAALTDVAHNVSDCAGGARVYLDVVAATAYYVRVSGYDWGTDIALNVARPQKPANDDFANAQQIGLPANVSGSNVDATSEPGEADPSPYGSGHSVWYRYTAATNDAVTFSVVDCAAAAGSLSQLAVYTGDSLGSLNDVGELAPACGDRSQVTLFPKAGTTYRVAVRGSGHASDAFMLRVALVPSASNPGPPSPPPNPNCPFQLAAPGSVTYSGTASGGGEVCLTTEPGFAGVSWFNLVDPPRDLCIPFAVEHYVPALSIVARRFEATTSSARVTGTFAGQSASGTFQAAIPPGGAGICSGRVVNWTATTQATPPPSISDATPPLLRLRGATAQHPLRSGRVTVSVRCPREACAAGASARIAGVFVQSPSRNLRPNVARTLTLRLTAGAVRAIRRALRAHRSIRTPVTVVALDAVGNPTRARRTMTLRR